MSAHKIEVLEAELPWNQRKVNIPTQSVFLLRVWNLRGRIKIICSKRSRKDCGNSFESTKEEHDNSSESPSQKNMVILLIVMSKKENLK